jgi:hypothetical protein
MYDIQETITEGWQNTQDMQGAGQWKTKVARFYCNRVVCKAIIQQINGLKRLTLNIVFFILFPDFLNYLKNLSKKLGAKF